MILVYFIQSYFMAQILHSGVLVRNFYTQSARMQVKSLWFMVDLFVSDSFRPTCYSLLLYDILYNKCIGLTITDNLEWDQHVSEISCKATKSLGFLWRNLALAPWHTKEVAYKTLVRPQLEYAAPVLESL